MANDDTDRTAPGRVPVLDLLRMLAILGVILFHYGFLGPTAIGTAKVALPGWASFARYGFLGVPVFFVISGFVIAYSAAGRTAMSFGIARIARIYPGFIICMTATFLVTLMIGGSAFHTSVAQWAANLIVAAPVFHQPYMDLPYWSLVIEITFYAWVTVLMALGLFPRRIDLIVVVWLGISMANELTFDSRAIERIFLSDYSGFFTTGLLIYEIHRGRRDALLYWLLSLAMGTAVFQAVHGLSWLRYHTDTNFSSWIAGTICLSSMLLIIWAVHVRRVPIPASLTLAIGGMTYPLYLLHQQIGYVALHWIGPVEYPTLLVAAIMTAIALVSLIVWKYVEPPCHRWMKRTLTRLCTQIGRPAAIRNGVGL